MFAYLVLMRVKWYICNRYILRGMNLCKKAQIDTA